MKRANLKNLALRIVTNRVFVFAVLGALLSWVTYRRFPLYITAPNFYAEDGSVFASNILHQGFLPAMLTPFTGYFIVGLYLLEGVGFLTNSLFFGGEMLNLPLAFAVVSYAFWAGVSCLPILLFWRDVKHRYYLVLICVALALVQLPSFNYAILGTIGNYKFAFLFIAFLLLVKRHLLPARSKLIYAVDVGLAICAFTNATVYLLLPFALLRYWPAKKRPDMQYIKGLLKDPSFVSLVALGVVVAPQVVYILIHGLPAQQNYMKEPYEWGKTVEIFVYRTFLFPFLFVLQKYLSDVVVVLVFAAAVWAVWRVARKEDRKLFIFGVYTAVVGTALFTSQRPGVTRFFDHYQSSGTDHFFYPQNWVFLFIVLFVVVRGLEHYKEWKWRAVVLAVLLASPVGVVVYNDFGRGVLSQRMTGSLWYNAQVLCSRPHSGSLNLPEYPGGVMYFNVGENVCTRQVADYIPERIALPLAPQGNNYVTVDGEKTIAQTFTSHYDQLSGISVFVSTFTRTGHGEYALDILDGSCTQTLRHAIFSAAYVNDGSYKDVHVAPMSDSKDKQYCFKITPSHLEQGKPAIALQLSPPSESVGGSATQNGSQLSQDVVFDVLYK